MTEPTDGSLGLDRLGRTHEERVADAIVAREWAHELHERDTVSAQEEDGVFTIRLRDGRVYRDPRFRGDDQSPEEYHQRPMLIPAPPPFDELDRVARSRYSFCVASGLSPAPLYRTLAVRLLDDLLQYSRAGRMEGEVRRVDTGALVGDIVSYLDPPPGIEVVTVGKMPVFQTAKAPLTQVLQNLISNAIKHHDREKGTIEISAVDYGDSYEFAVADDGPGIPAEFHERVFRMFQTLRPRDEVEGSGVGLAVVKKVVEWQGGVVFLESQPGMRGTTFRFTWNKQSSRVVA